jgi:hypothetical protein
MIRAENISLQIKHLLENGQMPNSGCSASLRRALRPLLDSGVVVEQRAGGGRRLVVRNLATFLDFSRSHFPEVSTDPDLGTRTAGVARFRDSKSFPSDTPEVISVRAWAGGALLKGVNPVPAISATLEHGVFSFLLREETPYSLCGHCALVENPQVFTHFERLQLPVRLAIWVSRGRASTLLLEWLAVQAPDFTLVHLPDYDPVGLLEFIRLRKRVGPRVSLHLPEDIADRFKKYSNRSLLEKPLNQAMLTNLRSNRLSEVRQVVALIDQNNACLEHEALLW